MTSACASATGIPWGVFGMSALGAGEFLIKPGFQFGSELSVTVERARMQPSEAELTNQSRVVIQGIEAIPVAHGTGIRPTAEIARYSCNLVRTGGQSMTEPARLVAVDAQSRLRLESSRLLNKPNFRP